ncbi:protein AKNAD1 [Pteropus alecto]|uniref:protein AKNAD1 n=1 Tax=Pteropus alecto TaxID=9402 RepID=UPI000D53BBE6|nr:protein AKNAD1 [Pteropus alecto]
MDKANFSEDTTLEQQEDSPYDEGFSQMKLYNDYNFTSKNDTLDVSDQIISAVDDPQEDATRQETCRNVGRALILDAMTENAVRKTYDKEKQCTTNLHMPANQGDLSKSNISDVLLHHLSKEEVFKGQGVNCETLSETSNADSFDEAVLKNIILRYLQNSWPKPPPPELADQLNPKRDGENKNKPSCCPTTAEGSTPEVEEPVAAGDSSHPENSNLLTETESPRDNQKSGRGQTPQKQQTEKARSGNGFKCSQGQVFHRFSDFSKVSPKVKIPKNNIIDKLLMIYKPASLLNQEAEESEGSLQEMHREAPAHPSSVWVFGRRRKLSSSSEVPGSSSDRSVSAVRLMLLSTQAAKLVTTNNGLCPHRAHGLVLGEMFQYPRNSVKQECSQLTRIECSSHAGQHGIESETSLFKLASTSQKDTSLNSSYIFQKISHGKKMCQKLREQTDQLKTKVQEFSKSIAQNSPCHLQDKRLVLEKLQGHLELLGQEFLTKKEKHLTLKQQVYKHESPAASDFDPERKVESEIFKLKMLLEDVKEKSDESKPTSALPPSSPTIPDELASAPSPPSDEEDPSKASGKQKHAETTSRSCAFCHQICEWKQKMEKKGHRRINCGRFPIVLQEKALHPNSILSPETGHSCYFTSGTGLRSNKCETCGTDMHRSPRVCHKEALKEFHYRYNTPGQNYLNHSERRAFVPLHFLNENKYSSPSCSKPKWICSQRANLKSPQDEHEPVPGKKNLKAFTTYSLDLATPLPHFHSCRISGSKYLSNFSGTEETKSEVLNLSLDYALRTATILKETTDQMIKTIAEDLAKAQKWRNQLKY